MKKIFVLWITVTLCSCASKYVPPSDLPLTEVTYRSNKTAQVGLLVKNPIEVLIFQNEDCEGVTFAGKLKGSEEKPDEFTIRVPINVPLVNTFRTPVANGYSYITTKFTPAEGSTYDIYVVPYKAPLITKTKNGIKAIDDSIEKPKKACKF